MTLHAQLVSETKQLPPQILKEALDFVRFLKLRRAIDPEQAYFWTKKWQTTERASDKDRKRSRILGDGSFKGLLKTLGA